MSELKAKGVDDVYIEYYETGKHELAQIYLKYEADKAIAELEESHKKEVGQLLIEIAELKEKRDTAGKLLNKALDCVSNGKNHMMSLARKKNHADYKRCLAMARWCSDVRELMHKLPVTDVDADRIRMKQCKWCRKWHKRWLTLADKYKEGNV